MYYLLYYKGKSPITDQSPNTEPLSYLSLTMIDINKLYIHELLVI